MTEFLSMGGDAAYVWPAYGITLAVVAINAWLARRKVVGALAEARRAAGQSRPASQPTVRQLQ